MAALAQITPDGITDLNQEHEALACVWHPPHSRSDPPHFLPARQQADQTSLKNEA